MIHANLGELDRAWGIAVSREGRRQPQRLRHRAHRDRRGLRPQRRRHERRLRTLTPCRPSPTEIDGVDGLDGARSVAVSPDGKQVYVAGENDDALAVFAREESSGTLVFVEARYDGEDGVDGIDQAYSVAVVREGTCTRTSPASATTRSRSSRASGSRCTGAGVGARRLIEIAAGGQVVYTVTATIDPAATGELVNEATLSFRRRSPSRVRAVRRARARRLPRQRRRPDQRWLPRHRPAAPAPDLALNKTDGTDVAIPGEEMSYTDGLQRRSEQHRRRDGHRRPDGIFPAGASWTCVAAPSGALTFVGPPSTATVRPGPVTLAGLDGAPRAVSPDGEHVYATGR